MEEMERTAPVAIRVEEAVDPQEEAEVMVVNQARGAEE